jgi:YVTN family beta-propeller protein
VLVTVTSTLATFCCGARLKTTSRIVFFPILFCVGILVGENTRSEPLATGKLLDEGHVLHAQDVGSFPVNMVVSPDGKFAITSDIGYRQAIWAVRLGDGTGTGQIPFPNKTMFRDSSGHSGKGATAEKPDLPDRHKGAESPTIANPSPRLRSLKTFGLYYGLAVAADHTIYAAQGANDTIAVLSLKADGSLIAKSTIQMQPQDFPAGVCLDDRGHLYIANQHASGENPYASSGSVAVFDTSKGEEIGRYSFRESFHGTTNYPLAICALRDGSKVYVGSERDNAVYVLRTVTPTKPTLAATIAVGTHPTALLLDRSQRRLFVANADSDTVSVIDTATDRVVSTLLMRPSVARDLAGCTPTSLALSADERRLFVTLADLNAVAVVDLTTEQLSGFIPTGWYPTSVAITPDHEHLLVANAKGVKARVPNVGRDPKTNQPARAASPLDLLEGDVQLLPIPDEVELSRLTRTVMTNNRLDTLNRQTTNPLAYLGLKSGKITHILYIIKENRTYDQVLGDLPQGNGDPSLCIFGRDVTPNLHALAERFVLLDNLYACGEVSGDGWVWSTQSMANPYVERNVAYSYSGRGRKYDFEGENNGYPTAGFPARDPDDKPTATNPIFKDGGQAIPDVAEAPGGHIWDLGRKHAISIRNYGFFESFDDDETGTVGGPDNYAAASGLQPSAHNLEGITDLDFRRFDLKYADSDAPSIWFKKSGDENCLFPRKTYGKYEAPSRFSEWHREFQMLLDKTPNGAAVPALTFIRMGQDHTQAASSGAHTPRSDCADNDYAIGQVVEIISHSPIWEHCAIFVIEDDAQSGADHVDCHRTTGYVISPYVPPRSIDHRFYNTVSYLRTIEQLLGLPPMTQYDATADCLRSWTNGEPQNREPYVAIIPSKELIAERNPDVHALKHDDPRRSLVVRSDAMDFVHPDAAPTDELNEIIWRTVKGANATTPESKSSALQQLFKGHDHD